MAITLEEPPAAAILQVPMQFLRQRRRNRHVPVRIAFGVRDLDLRWIAVDRKIVDLNMNEFARTGEE